VSRPADAEDVAQDALVVAVEKIETCREPARFAAWLFAIVRTRSLNFLDRRRLRDVAREPEIVEQSGEAPCIERAKEREQLLAALLALAPVQREIVLLHDLEDWTHAEIAAALDLSEVMSRQHLFQARRLLRHNLAETRDEQR
jgi:RNA polymerase sigma-70 factor (ECF subfamily)